MACGCPTVSYSFWTFFFLSLGCGKLIDCWKRPGEIFKRTELKASARCYSVVSMTNILKFFLVTNAISSGIIINNVRPNIGQDMRNIVGK